MGRFEHLPRIAGVKEGIIVVQALAKLSNDPAGIFGRNLKRRIQIEGRPAGLPVSDELLTLNQQFENLGLVFMSGQCSISFDGGNGSRCRHDLWVA